MLGILGFLIRLIQECTNGEGEPQQHKWGSVRDLECAGTSLTAGNNYSHTPRLQFQVHWGRMNGCQVVQNV